MLIHPLGIVLSKILNRTGQHKKENPLATLAMEGTLTLFIGLYLAYTIFQINTEWFYPIMLMIIGIRYVIFQTIYGMKIYWILGMALTVAGILCLQSNQPMEIAAGIGGIIEIIFAILIIRKEKASKSIA